MKNGVMTNQDIREKLEYERAKELFPNCKDLEKKGRLWKLIADYNRKHSCQTVQKASLKSFGNQGR